MFMESLLLPIMIWQMNGSVTVFSVSFSFQQALNYKISSFLSFLSISLDKSLKRRFHKKFLGTYRKSHEVAKRWKFGVLVL